MLATLGSIVFVASADLVRTFADAQHTTSGRWTAHEVIGQKPAQEFGGPELRKLSLSIRLDVALGVDPETEVEALRDAVETGEVLPFMLGGEPHGNWICKEAAESWRNIGQNGGIGVIAVDLSLEEYA